MTKEKSVECPFCYKKINIKSKAPTVICPYCITYFNKSESESISAKESKSPRMYNAPIISDLVYSGVLDNY